MNEKDKYIKEYKAKNPIVDCLGCGARYKWIRYLDGIDLRYGHDTLKSAEMARAKSAHEAWAMLEMMNQPETCHCGAVTTHQVIDSMGECVSCAEKRYI